MCKVQGDLNCVAQDWFKSSKTTDLVVKPHLDRLRTVNSEAHVEANLLTDTRRLVNRFLQIVD